MGLVGQTERQAVGVVVDLAHLLAAGVDGLVVVQASAQAEYSAIAEHVVGAEVVLVPEVVDLGGVQAGAQALERLVVDTGGAGAVGFHAGGTVLAAELAEALFGTRRDAVEGAQVEAQVVEFGTVQERAPKLDGRARLPM